MSINELREIVLEHRGYFEKAVKNSTYSDVKYRIGMFWSKAWRQYSDSRFWIEGVGFVVMVTIVPVMLLISPVWMVATSIIMRRRVVKILREKESK